MYFLLFQIPHLNPRASISNDNASIGSSEPANVQPMNREERIDVSPDRKLYTKKTL